MIYHNKFDDIKTCLFRKENLQICLLFYCDDSRFYIRYYRNI
jgi:hypothetical protein